MSNFIDRTFKAIPRGYYIRNLYFGLGFSAFMIFFLVGLGVASSPDLESFKIGFFLTVWFIAQGFLYPYAKYAVDMLVKQLKGDRVYIVSVLGLIMGQFVIISICWCAVIYIAPFGLVALYFRRGLEVAR